MKLNLGCGNDIRAGYLNIDRVPTNQIPPEVYRQGDIGSLDWLTEDNTIDEILAIDCLEYLPIEIVKSALDNWAKKLVEPTESGTSVGGTLKILVPDAHAVAKAFYQGQFNLPEYSQMTFGTQKENDNRLSVIDAITLLDTLKEIRLTISVKRYEGIAIYVEATK